MRLANQTTVSHEACPADWPFPTQLFIVAQHSTKAPPGLYPVLLLELENSHQRSHQGKVYGV
jgi:hypothetical protein